MTSEKRQRGNRVTSFDVAALAGVSQSAVSRAFSTNASITDRTRDRVFAAARKLNYVPNSIARSLTTSSTHIIAMIVGNMTNPFYVTVLQRFSRALQSLGRQILVFNVGPDFSADDALLRVLQYQVDGVVITSAQLSMKMANICIDRGIPLVLFNRYVPGTAANCVRCDNAHGGRLIAQAFIAAGARSFAMITGDDQATTSKDRVQGFVGRLLEAGIPPAAIESAKGYSSYDGGHAAALRLFRARGRPWPDALFCINDIMAMGALDALRLRLGIAVPGKLMVAGFDDIPEARRLPYQLTTVRQPIDAMVQETLAFFGLADSAYSGTEATHRALPGRLILRNTVPLRDAADLAQRLQSMPHGRETALVAE